MMQVFSVRLFATMFARPTPDKFFIATQLERLFARQPAGNNRLRLWIAVIVLLALPFPFAAYSQATTGTGAAATFSKEWGNILSLDGQWEVAAGNKDRMPVLFPATVPVPGLISLAKPAFAGVGEENSVHKAYWYRKKFRLPGSIPALARLKIFKAMFGTQVFLNGRRVGESPYNFTPLYFNVTPMLRANNAENELVIRIGAHISAAPDSVVTGGDPERHRYPPGIYDRVQLLFSDDPYLLRTQVVPDVATKTIGVVLDMAAEKTGGPLPRLRAVVYHYKTGKIAGSALVSGGALQAGQTKQLTVRIALPGAALWTPEDPQLYVLQVSDGRYTYKTRFGMRSFTVDSAFTNRALLNGKPCFIRGTNFAIHRFFEDSLSGGLPWDKEWVRRLFRRFTQMEMNGVRFVFSPAPELWYEVADEAGMMVFDEYAIWYAYQPLVGPVHEEAADPYKKWSIWPRNLTTRGLVREYTAWMQERWNHPSVIVWDAQNETWAQQTGAAIDAVRGLDGSHRIWDNGWSPPAAAGDMREAHPYFERWVEGTEMKTDKGKTEHPFTTADLAGAAKMPATFYLPYQYAHKLPPNWYWQQPCVINEYAYLWLNRDGTATELTKPYYDAVLGAGATADQRRELYARNLAAVTEYWRATRSCFGILYPFGLAGGIAGAATGDNWTDVAALQLDPYFEKYVPDAFAALGVCAELWQTQYKIDSWAGTQAEGYVAIINDLDTAYNSHFFMYLLRDGAVVSSTRYRYAVGPGAVVRVPVKIDLPKLKGPYELVTELHGRRGKTVRSYRTINMVE